MRPPSIPQPDHQPPVGPADEPSLLDRIGRALLGFGAGAVAGVMLAVMVCVLPTWFMSAEDAGILGMVALFWLGPLGAFAGAVAGMIGARRYPTQVSVVAATSILAATLALAVAPSHHAPPAWTPPSPPACRDVPRRRWRLHDATAISHEHVCPDARTWELHLSIFPDGIPVDSAAPGNVLVLDASSGTTERPVNIDVRDAADGFDVAYDRRARLVRREGRVGARPVRLVSEDSVPATGDILTPPATPAITTPMAASAQMRPCMITVRDEETSPFGYRVFRRDCPGQPPTIEVSLTESRAGVARDTSGIALVLDASTEAWGDTIRVRVANADSGYVRLGYDRRARVLRRFARVGNIRVDAVVESDSALRRRWWDTSPAP